MAQVTVQNDSGKPLSLHPWGKRLAKGATLDIDTEIDHPELFLLVEDLIARSLLSVSSGTMPAKADIQDALDEFDVRNPRAIEERTRINEIKDAADQTAQNALDDLDAYHNV